MDAIVNKQQKNSDQRKPERADAEEAVRTLLAWAGEEVDREGLHDTPKRVAKAYGEFFKGYDEDPADILKTTFDDVGGYSDIVLVRDIPFYSHCEHHMVPFIGTARLQTQENLTTQIASSIDENLKPRGVAVLMEAEHMCMSLRGVQKAGVSTVTTEFTGIFKEEADEQVRFMQLIRGFGK